MNNDNVEDNKFENMILIVIMSIYAVIGIHFMPLMLIIFPVPFVVFSLKNGIIKNVINIILICIIIGITESIKYGLFLLIMFLPITIALYILIEKRKKVIEILGISTITIFLSILLILGTINYKDASFTTELENQFKEIFTAQKEIIKEEYNTNYERLKREEILEKSYKTLLLSMPAVLLIISFLSVYLNYQLILFGSRKIGINIVKKPRFSRFSLPSNIMLGILAMFLVSYIIGRFDIEYSEIINMNLIVLVNIVFSIQGLSVIDYYLIKTNIFPVIKFVTYIMIFLSIVMVFLLTIIGFIDIIFDLRKIKTDPK